MIEKWHEKTNRPFFKVIFTLVTISFVLGGMGTGIVGSDHSAVKVNGVSISQEQFQQVKNREQNALVQRLGEKAWELIDSPEYATEFNQNIINGLVDEELLRQYANELKLGVSIDQIKGEIVNTPAFQSNGKFDNNLYQQALRNSGLNADGYASIVAEGMLFSQVQEGIIGSDFSVPAQQEQLAKLIFQKRQARVATYSIANEAKNQTASAEEIQAYYDAHKATLTEPEKLTVEYVTLTPADVAKQAQISEEQIEAFYAKNRAEFTTKGEARLAHIQLANEADAKTAEQAVKNGEDFAKVAKEKSTDKLSASQGGDLGWAKAGTFPVAFENAAKALNVGEVSQPISIDGAFHIIKVLDRKPETVLPLEQVKAQITKKLSEESQSTLYSSVASKMANDAFENSGSLETVAKNAGVVMQKTVQFTKENVPTALQNDKVLKVLFEGDLRQSGQNSEALDVGDDKTPRTMFVRVSDYQAERVKTLDEAKAEVEAAVKRQKAEHALLAKVEADLKALNDGQSTAVEFGAPQTYVYVEAESKTPALAQTLFAMPKPEGKTIFQQGRNEQGDIILVALESVTDGTMAEFQPLAQQFRQAEQLLLRADLIKDLRERASIDVNTDYLDSQIVQ